MAEEEGTLTLHSHGPARTRQLGRRLGELLAPGDVVLLEGEFGAGKTVFAQGIGQGLGVAEYVTSPSFTLINEYRAPSGTPLYHVDLYRLESTREAVDLGLLDLLGGEGISLVEWPERAREIAGEEHLLVRLYLTGTNRRRLVLSAVGERHRRLLARFGEAVGEK